MKKKLEDVKKVLRQNGISVPKTVKPSEASGFIQSLKTLRDDYRRYAPFMQSCALFSEIMLGNGTAEDENNAVYVKWFTDKTTGVWEQLNSSEISVLQNWKDLLDKGPSNLQGSLENNFFIEDMKKPIADAEATKQLIQVFREAMLAFRGDTTLFYQQDVQVYDNFVALAKKLPSPKDVKFEGYEAGTFRTSHTAWVYDKFSGVLKSENISAAIAEPPVTWDIRNTFLYTNPTYGTIIWNGKSWVWTHQKCPYTIRYDWEPTRAVFYQVLPAKDPTGKKKMPPILTDWQIKEGGIHAVSVGKKETPPLVPPDLMWPFKGKMPPPVILIVATFIYIIKPTVRAL